MVCFIYLFIYLSIYLGYWEQMQLFFLPLKDIGEHMHVWYELFEPLKKYAFLICKKYVFSFF